MNPRPKDDPKLDMPPYEGQGGIIGRQKRDQVLPVRRGGVCRWALDSQAGPALAGRADAIRQRRASQNRLATQDGGGGREGARRAPPEKRTEPSILFTAEQNHRAEGRRRLLTEQWRARAYSWLTAGRAAQKADRDGAGLMNA